MFELSETSREILRGLREPMWVETTIYYVPKKTRRSQNFCRTSPTKKHVWGFGSRDGKFCIHCAKKWKQK